MLKLYGTEDDQRRSGSIWQAKDYGLKSMNWDPAGTVSNSTPLTPAGTLIVFRLPVRQAMLITNIITWITTAGVGLTSGQCFAALYQGGSLLAQTADQASAWGSTGLKIAALSSPQWVGPQSKVEAAFWYNGTTGPALLRGSSNGAIQLGGSTPDRRCSTADTGRTTTAPASLGAQSQLTTIYWCALS